MPYPFALGSTLLRAQPSKLPSTFCRYKSITAAIEKGRQTGPGRFSSARPRTSLKDDRPRAAYGREDRPRGSFRDRDDRSDRPRSFNNDRSERPRSFNKDRDDRPRASNDGNDDAPRTRPSRPSRSGSSIGARRRRWEDEDGPRQPRESRDESAVDRRIRDDDAASRFSPRMPGGSGGRSTRSERRSAPSDRSDEFARPLRKTERRLETRLNSRTDRDDDAPRRTPRSDRDGRAGDTSMREKRSFDRNSSDAPARERPARFERAPDSLPYTTAASDFIYGYSSVLAAIKANRRKFYRLYISQRGEARDVERAAKAANIRDITSYVGEEYARAMDKASSGRPHNGFILEASPLPVPPITELLPTSGETTTSATGTFSVTLGTQTLEDRAINGSQTTYPYRTSFWRHPLILYVDGVLDEGNLGAIARSAYVLGVDALITPSRQSAPWSHIALKASAGAAEAVPIFKVDSPADFLGKSARAGWRIYASDAVPAAPSSLASLPATDASSAASTAPTADTDDSAAVVYTFARGNKRLPATHSPVAEHPTILMMGAEGTGLRTSLLNLAHYKVGIRQGRATDEVGVDSLNVSVAASVLCFEALKRPVEQVRKEEEILF